MESVGVRELRQNLSVWLRRVQAGAAFTVTDRGRAVAVLSPLPVGEDPLARHVAAGTVHPAAEPDAPLPRRVPVAGPPTQDVLRRLRDEERG